MSSHDGRKGSPLEWLATDVILLAAQDFRNGKAGLERFFYSEWFEELCSIVGEDISPDDIRKELKVLRPAQMELGI